MINKFKPKSEFARNVLTLMTGTTIAQAIPIAISPILTRIYTPEDFGIFALYMSVASILSVVATGRYELAIMLPKKDEDAINIVALSLIISFFVSFIALLIVFFFNTQITDFLGNPEISFWLYFIPITVLLTGFYQSLNYWSNRQKKYENLASSKIIQSSTTASTNLLLGVIGMGTGGLFVGTFLGQSSSVFFLFKKNLNNIPVKLNRLKLFLLAKKYIDFLRYSTFGAILNSLSFNLFSILILKIFSASILGFYSLVYRILTLPSVLIGSSISQVYLHESINEKNIYGNNIKFFMATFKKLLLISTVIYIPMYFYIEDFMMVVFGDDWKISGEIAKIVIPLMLVRFVSSVLSSTLIIYEKQKAGLIINFLLTMNIIVIAYITYLYQLDYNLFFHIYMITGVILYAFFLFYYYLLSKEKE